MLLLFDIVRCCCCCDLVLDLEHPVKENPTEANAFFTRSSHIFLFSFFLSLFLCVCVSIWFGLTWIGLVWLESHTILLTTNTFKYVHKCDVSIVAYTQPPPPSYTRNNACAKQPAKSRMKKWKTAKKVAAAEQCKQRLPKSVSRC